MTQDVYKNIAEKLKVKPTKLMFGHSQDHRKL